VLHAQGGRVGRRGVRQANECGGLRCTNILRSLHTHTHTTETNTHAQNTRVLHAQGGRVGRRGVRQANDWGGPRRVLPDRQARARAREVLRAAAQAASAGMDVWLEDCFRFILV